MDRSSQNPQKFRLLEGGAEDRRTPEEELKARVRYQEALAGLGKSALSEANSADLLNEAARVVAEVLSVEYCKILELSPDGTELLLRAGAGWATPSWRTGPGVRTIAIPAWRRWGCWAARSADIWRMPVRRRRPPLR